MPTIKITAIVNTKNEEELLAGCLRHLTWADELVVVDNQSTDKTLEIAKSFGATVISDNFGPYHPAAAQKNAATTLASGDWLYFCDADERVSTSLQKEILAAIIVDNFSAFRIPRLNYFLGTPLKHGGWYPDYQVRLLRKSDLIKWAGEPHDKPVFKGGLGTLSSDMIHFSHKNIDEMTLKLVRFGSGQAKEWVSKNPTKKITAFTPVKTVFMEVARRFFRRVAFLDGPVGVFEVFFQAFGLAVIDIKIWQLQQKQPLDKVYKELDDRTW